MDVTRFRSCLLRWFRRAKRPLPWRLRRDAYAIWVSEIMLQQTTVAAVIPFYERFMKRFPTLDALAVAHEDEVLALWSGLGYYSRGRNLRLAAMDLVMNRGGLFPRDVETAMSLKGVGPYTASAVTSIAYGAKAAVVDGNVRRVLSRIHAVRDLTERRALEMATDLLSSRAPGTWNEAMMELGATICTPRNPTCDRCPVSVHCAGRDRPEHWSQGKPRRASMHTPVEMALVLRGPMVMLTRIPDGVLLGGLYELPHSGLPGDRGLPNSLRERYRGVLRIESEPAATLRHTVTHHRIEASIFRARAIKGRTGAQLSLHTFEAAQALPLGGLTRKALRILGVISG